MLNHWQQVVTSFTGTVFEKGDSAKCSTGLAYVIQHLICFRRYDIKYDMKSFPFLATLLFCKQTFENGGRAIHNHSLTGVLDYYVSFPGSSSHTTIMQPVDCRYRCWKWSACPVSVNVYTSHILGCILCGRRLNKNDRHLKCHLKTKRH